MNKDDWQVRIIQLLTLPGMILAYYLLLYHNGSLIAGCTGNGWDDCGLVSGPDAAYSAIGPIPVALVGLIGYALIFLVIWLGEWWARLDDNLPELLIGLASSALLFTLGLTGLELFVIHSFCRYCIFSAVIVVIIFVLSLSYMRSD